MSIVIANSELASPEGLLGDSDFTLVIAYLLADLACSVSRTLAKNNCRA